MTEQRLKNQNNTEIVDKLPQRIPILYVWYGKTIPEDYIISLAELDYPVVFMKDAELNRKFSRQIMDIEKSDYYRLQYLYENGGIYSDLDNVVNYDCLMKLVEPYRNQDKLLFMTDGSHTRAKMKQMNNNLIFAPSPKMPLLKKMLDEVDETKEKIWGFAGMKHLGQYSEPIEMNMDKCVRHIGDWSWFAASNEVLNRNSGPNSRFRQRLSKKKEIIQENVILQKQLEEKIQTTKKLNFYLNKQTVNYKDVEEEIANIKKIHTEKQIEAEKETHIQPEQFIDQTPLTFTFQTQYQSLDLQWEKEKISIQNQIQQISLQNEHIQFQRNVSLFAAGGSILILLILMLAGIKFIKRKAVPQNQNGVCVFQRPIVEESRVNSF